MKKELIISKVNGILREYYYVPLLLLLSIIFLSSALKSNHILNNIHYINDMTFESENMHIFLKEGGAFPLWTPYFYSGQPFIAIPEYYIFDLNFIYILLFGNIFLAMSLALVSYFFLSGMGMFLLVKELLHEKNAAFIAALVYMFNGLVHTFIIPGHLNVLESYALIPFIFLFLHKALHSSRYVLYSILSAISLALVIYSGGMVFLLFIILIIGSYIGWQVIDNNPFKKLQRMIIVSLIIGTIFFGLSGLKLLPMFEFTDMSSRASGVSYQEFLGNPISLSQIASILVFPKSSAVFGAFIGFAAAILVLFSLLSFRKKIVLYCILLLIMGILLASGGFVAEILYKIPGFDKMRHIERALVLFVFAASILAAVGLNNLIDKVKKVQPKYITLIIVVAIMIELILMQPFPKSMGVENTLEIPTLSEIVKDSSDFKIATMSLSTPIGASGYNYFAQHKIPEVKGGGGIWINDYVQYLAVAQQYAPSKLFGVLGAKYIISDKEVADEGLVLLKEFEKCIDCKIWEAHGPYLYQNKYALPRASTGHSSILLIGSEAEMQDISLQLMLNVLNTSTVIVKGKNVVSLYRLEELKQYDIVLLLSASAAESDLPLLQAYSDSGGIILPKVIEGESTLNPSDIQQAVKKSSMREIAISDVSVNEFTMNAPIGWVLLSERIAHFSGWHASLNDKEITIERANSAISAVFVPFAGEVHFKYRPSSFVRGMSITIITMIAIAGYSGYIFINRKNKQKEIEREDREKTHHEN